MLMKHQDSRTPAPPVKPAASPYSCEVDLTDLNDARSMGVLLVPPGSRVLDIGAADGSVARALVARGCSVCAVEVHEATALEAQRVCDEVICADVEELDLRPVFARGAFDVVLLLDVLEHLRHPDELLRRIADLISPRTVVIASIPNVTHASIRIRLLQGRFTRTDTGLLDRTHLQFLDRDGVEQLFAGAGLQIRDMVRVSRELGETELQVTADELPAEVVRIATADTDSHTYQFVVVAASAAGAASAYPPGEMLAGRLQDRLTSVERGWREVESYVRKLERENAAHSRVIAERDAALAGMQSSAASASARAEELAVSFEGFLAVHGELALGIAALRDVHERHYASQHAEHARCQELLIAEHRRLDELRAEEHARREANLRDQAERAHALQEEDFARRAGALRQELAALCSQKAALEQQNAEAAAENHRLKEQRHALDGRMVELETACRRLQLEALQAAHEADAECVRLATQAEDLRGALAQAETAAAAVHETAAYLRRDLEVKEEYIVALREREVEAEREHAAALIARNQRAAECERRVAVIETELVALREIEQANRRVPRTPRYWVADRLNNAVKRVPPLHRGLRWLFGRVTGVDPLR
jgi:2-polyprenyl-3-methyl-5-hydroxy-6-metoxy-1,4-benzoquinol methylase